jgi:hypothetical protein
VELEASLFVGEDSEDEEEQQQQQQEEEVLQLGHLTALTSLVDCVADESGEYGDDGLPSHAMGPGDVFPPNLQQLKWQGDCRSVVPLLPLQQLRAMQLCFDGQPPAAPELAQMSSMGQLTELGFVYSTAGTFDAAIADAWAVLPLRSLKLLNWAEPHASDKPPVVPLEVVARLSALSQLTCLELGIPLLCGSLGVHLAATPGQLAAALAPLTGLRTLHISGFDSVAADVGDAADASAAGRPARTASSRAGKTSSTSAGSEQAVQHGEAGVVALLEALGGLWRMQRMDVQLPLVMAGRDVSRAARAAQRLPAWVTEACVSEEGLHVKV